MATFIGQMSKFDEEEEWMQYVERLNHYFITNGIEDAKRCKATFTVIGPACCKQLRSLISPSKPANKMYKELMDVLQEFYSPKPNNTCSIPGSVSQGSQLPCTVYLLELHSLAEHCNFGTTPNVILC